MRAALIPVLALLASGCATTAPRTPQTHQLTPGYRCEVRLDDRKTSEIWLRADGSVFSSQWEWAWRSDFEEGTGLWVIHSKGPNINPNSVPHAAISSNPAPFDPKRTARSRLALTNQPGTDWLDFHYAIAKSDPPGRGSSSASLWISWSDLVAYAEGSPALYLLRLDTKSNSVTSRPFPRGLILEAKAEITAMAQQMDAKVADFANRCETVDDIDPLPDMLV